ncbi:kinase-like domain-containing protein [Rhizophagus irregularis DAOM 181602=DAOM 197198]|nr:kinase-like domain-containing protein [Rhizophagus irregularis DAOM 181602=DAOM 197198]
MNKENETRVSTESKELNISDKNSNINLENCCYYCNKPFIKELWCEECDPFRMVEGWTSGNNDIDRFYQRYNLLHIKQVGEGAFSKVYSAIWNNGKTKYSKQDDGSWKKEESNPIKVALKKLNGSQNMLDEHLNELKVHCNSSRTSLTFHGMTKDPDPKEFMMVLKFANQGNLRSFLSNNFNSILWKDKINYLYCLIYDLENLHNIGYYHKNLHSGNILQIDNIPYISDFRISEPSFKQKSDDKICGVLPYIAPEVLNGESYTLLSDIYSFEIYNGLRPEFGKGTPEIYKELAYKCMNADLNQRPTANELRKDIRAMFEEADKEIPNISTSYEKSPDAIYTSRLFTFNNLTKPVNSSLITSYLDEE